MNVETFVMLKDTKVFKKGQKVFLIFGTGNLAGLVRGRYKSGGRWVSAWVHYDPDEKMECKYIGEIDIPTLAEDEKSGIIRAHLNLKKLATRADFQSVAH